MKNQVSDRSGILSKKDIAESSARRGPPKRDRNFNSERSAWKFKKSAGKYCSLYKPSGKADHARPLIDVKMNKEDIKNRENYISYILLQLYRKPHPVKHGKFLLEFMLLLNKSH
ncbi:hypothetical protein BC343_19420 [Mucilaginibacter pedocola]|uniref:Uncharacterized protein n=1 Tax=Mucilaginibacter pedocola TaxID=1792845 RepID=A0A1S9P6M5_9SPHI|nr:hypothetical protein BC343_19420 [Mucilaginibacter pedocola]